MYKVSKSTYQRLKRVSNKMQEIVRVKSQFEYQRRYLVTI